MPRLGHQPGQMSDAGASGTTFVGRDPELDLLRDSLARTTAGAGAGIDLVAGEVGIGKTTLVERLAAATDATVLSGSCVPVGGESMPFAPVIAALRGLVRGRDASQAAARRWPMVFDHLVPGAHPAGEQPAAHDTAMSPSGQLRLFEAVLAMLGDLGDERPVLWVVEDLQWADRSTLDLISFLGRNLSRERVRIVATIRDDGLPRVDGLRTWLAEFARLPDVTRMTLGRLDHDDTRDQIALLSGATHVSRGLVDAIFERSAGNPLYTEQLLPCEVSPGLPLPANLRDLIRARFASLPAPTHSLLGVAAVVGGEFELAVLSAVARTPAEQTESNLRAAVDRQLIHPVHGATYGFTHPLFREVLEADLLPGERQRLHARTGEALREQAAHDERDSFGVAGRIAYHWDMADVPDLALAAAIRAGLAAEDVYAFAEADEHFSRAVDIGARIGPAPDQPIDRIDVLVHASQAAHLTGDGPRAVRLAEDAATLTEDPARRSAILERKGAYCFNAGLVDVADAAYHEALELLADEPSPARARVYAGLGLLAMAWTRMESAEDACREAIRIARLVGARAEEGRALNALGAVVAHRGDFATGVEYSRAAIGIAKEVGDPDDLGMAYVDCAHVLGLAGRYAEAVEVCAEGFAEMRRVGLVRQDGSFILANAAASLIKSGQLERAGALLDEALALQSQGLRAFPVLEQAARLCMVRGDLEAARARTGQARALLDEYGAPDAWWRELYETETELLLWEGDPAAAYETSIDGLGLAERGDERRFAGSLIMLAARALADQRRRASSHGSERRRIGRLVDDLRARVTRLDPDPLDVTVRHTYDAQATATTIAAELGRAAGGVDPSPWSRAATAWERIGQPVPAAYCVWREAEAAVVGKERTSRQLDTVRRAHDSAARLGAGCLLAETEDLARVARIDLVSGAEQPAPADSWADTGLTPRELEILAGLVAGRTNREIADSLFISVKTASVHVSNVLRKLGVAGREEAARVAQTRGMAPAE